MEYTLDRFVAEVRATIHATGSVAPERIELETPRPTIPADLAFPTFRVAKEAGLPAPDFAQTLAAQITLPADSLIGRVEAVGPFVNFVRHTDHFGYGVLEDILRMGRRYGESDDGANQTIVIDYSSPNVAKRMHIGHIRSTIIGQALVHIFRALGYRTIGDNHLGDWGKQFGIIIAAIMRDGKPTGEGEEALEQLEAIYARYSDEMQHDPHLDEEARSWSLKLEQGDPTARDLWKWSVQTTLIANQYNYDRLGVRFDHIYGESFYESMLADVIQDALDSGVATRDDDGGVVVKSLQNLPTFLLQRNDGGTLYITRDVATIAFRVRTFAPSRILYVVGAQQELHFRQLFALVDALGYAPGVTLVHVPFGTVFDADGKPLSTRKGNQIFLDRLLKDAIARARAVVEQKSAHLDEEQKDQVANAVGIGAVIYNDLYQDTRRNITLDWDRMLATEGNSATYLQYSYARCCSILRKAADEGIITAEQPTYQTAALLHHATEQQLLKHLSRMPAAIREAGARYAPFVVADWCYTTAREFGVFFEQCPVLRAETDDLRCARLRLVQATAQALHNGLSLLGIQTPERM